MFWKEFIFQTLSRLIEMEYKFVSHEQRQRICLLYESFILWTLSRLIQIMELCVDLDKLRQFICQLNKSIWHGRHSQEIDPDFGVQIIWHILEYSRCKPRMTADVAWTCGRESLCIPHKWSSSREQLIQWMMISQWWFEETWPTVQSIGKYLQIRRQIKSNELKNCKF